MCESDGSAKKNTLSLKTKLLFLIERGLSSREILSALAIAKTNLAALTKELANDGLIQKTRDARDRREKKYTLTPKGERCLRTRKEAIEANFSEAASGKEKEAAELVTKLVVLLGSGSSDGEQGEAPEE